MNRNILLEPFDTPYQTPPFHLIKEDDYLPAFKEAINRAEKEIEQIVNNDEPPSFENSVEALEAAGKQLTTVSNIFFNLNHADTNENIQKIAREVSPLLTKFNNDIWLNQKLFKRIKSVYDNKNNVTLREDRQKLLDDTFKEFVRRGALLTGEEKNSTAKLPKSWRNCRLNLANMYWPKPTVISSILLTKKTYRAYPKVLLKLPPYWQKAKKKRVGCFRFIFRRICRL